MNKEINKNTYLNNLFQHIENNMPDDLDTALIKSIGYVSCDKLYRDFYSLTGHSVKEYIRRRRLSNALALIKTSDMGFTDIAFQCGYSSHQALCRAVRQTLSMTPSDYRNGDTYYYFPPFKGNPLQSVNVSNDSIPHTIRVLFYHPSLLDIENTAVNTFLQAFPDYAGRIFGRNGEQAGRKLCYELYLTDTSIDLSRLSAYGFKPTYQVPSSASLFAESTVKNDKQKINAAWDYLFAEWLQNSMFEYRDEPYYEEYILKNNKIVKLRLYLPINKRSTETRIALVNNPNLRFIAAKAKGYNAEKTASQTVINYLSEHYPTIIKTSKEMYLQKDANTYTCGIKYNSDLININTSNIKHISTNYNNYLVMYSSVMGDYDQYAEFLLSFAKNNRMDVYEKEIFAVYDAGESFDNLHIKMYCPVKIRKK